MPVDQPEVDPMELLAEPNCPRLDLSWVTPQIALGGRSSATLVAVALRHLALQLGAD